MHSTVNATDLWNPFTTYIWFTARSLPLCSLPFCSSPFLSLLRRTLKMSEKSGNQHRQRKSDGLNLKWTGTGLCRSTYVWSFSLFTLATVIILPWLEPFVVCACCGWCAVIPNEVCRNKKRKKRCEHEHFNVGPVGQVSKNTFLFFWNRYPDGQKKEWSD